MSFDYVKCVTSVSVITFSDHRPAPKPTAGSFLRAANDAAASAREFSVVAVIVATALVAVAQWGDARGDRG
jgi:hypothetical protein